MPAIPVYRPMVNPQGGGFASVSPIGSAARYGSAVIGIGDMMARRGEQLLQEYDATKAYDAFNELRNQSREKLNDLLTREGSAAFGVQAEYNEWEKKVRGELETKALTVHSQRTMFSQIADRHRNADLNHLAGHEAQQTKLYKRATLGGMSEIMERESRLNAFDDKALDGIILEYYQAEDRLFPNRMPEEKTIDRLKFLQNVRTSSAMELIDKNPQYAAKKLEEWKPDLGEKYDILKKRLEGKIGDNRLELAFAALGEKYKGNLYGMLSHVNNQNNWAELGLDWDTSGKMSTRINGLINQREAMESHAITSMHRRQEATGAAIVGQLATTDDPVKRQAILASMPQMVKNQQISVPLFNAITKEIKQGAVEDDLTALEVLDEAIARHEDVAGLAIKMHQSGRIKTTTADNYVKASKEKPVSEGASYIYGALDPGQLSNAPDARFRREEAKSIYYQRLREKPDQDPIALAKTIVGSYQHGLKRTMRGSRKPEYMGAGDMTSPNDLQTARSATVKAFQSGLMGNTEDPKVVERYRDEVDNIQRLYERAMQTYMMDSSVSDNEAVRKNVEAAKKKSGQY